jgi:hypothetical protein
METFFLRFFAYYSRLAPGQTGDRIMAGYGSVEKQCRRALVHHPRRDARGLLGSWTLMALMALASATARSALAPEPEAAAKEEILALVQQMQDAWNRGDFRGYMQDSRIRTSSSCPAVASRADGRDTDHYVRDYGSSAEARGRLLFRHPHRAVGPGCGAADQSLRVAAATASPVRHQYAPVAQARRPLVIAVNHVSSTRHPRRATAKG